MKTALFLAAVVATWTNSESARAETVVCSNLTGMRVDRFSASQSLVEAQKRGKTEWSKDAISGMVATLVWSNADREVAFSTSSNANDTGGLSKFSGFKVVDEPALKTFVVRQEDPPHDDAVVMVSYYPDARKLIWSGHATRFLVFRDGMHGKFMVADCR